MIPHGFLTHGTKGSGIPQFYRGTDFSYPEDNTPILDALDAAWEAGCLIFKGTSDNRGRRAVFVESAMESVVAVGSSNRRGHPADLCSSADYVEVGAPGGERQTDDPSDRIWSTGGGKDYLSFTGGCMAAGFAGGVAALVSSRFPELSNRHVRQILRNTAQGEDWNPCLGWGILDASKAVSLKSGALCQILTVNVAQSTLTNFRRKWVLRIAAKNQGVFDVEKARVVAFSGDPRRAAAPQGTLEQPVTLVTRQMGHSIGAVVGLHSSVIDIELMEKPSPSIWVQVCSLDRDGSREAETVKVDLTQGKLSH